jgi:uncharacterized metal-binding protein YceD (DUF177 family)
MRLDLSEILHEAGKTAKYTLNEPPLVDEDVECTLPISGELQFTNAGETLLIRGKMQTALALACSRCPEYFEQSLECAVEEQFEIQRTGGGLRSQQQVKIVEADENPIATQLFEGMILDLTEMLRQYLLLETPTRPLPECDRKGRCSQCHRLPQEVLDAYTPPEATPSNNAFAQLAERLKNEES